MSIKEEYEKQYKETVELLKLLGRAGGVACELQLSALRRTCQLAVAYGKCASLFPSKPVGTQCQQEEENNKKL